MNRISLHPLLYRLCLNQVLDQFPLFLSCLSCLIGNIQGTGTDRVMGSFRLRFKTSEVGCWRSYPQPTPLAGTTSGISSAGLIFFLLKASAAPFL